MLLFPQRAVMARFGRFTIPGYACRSTRAVLIEHYVALDSAAGSLKTDAVAGMACSALAINQLTFLSAADFTRQLSSIFLVIKKPQTIADLGFCCRRLTMTDSDSCHPGTHPSGRLRLSKHVPDAFVTWGFAPVIQ